ncbi:MAG: hypothetical protein EHM78_25375 [Myxococcaceae bacterium]|nr:MAG: hypothetical protein EHM78_25375 [Myxococcaceae bacterium]
MSWRGWWCLWVLAAAGCAPTPVRPSATPSAEAASAKLARLVASEPDTFKMVHQVVGRFQGRTYPMSGYLLGRRDGSFRVSAMVAVGPKLFDVAKVSSRWESRIHLSEAAARLDPLEVGHAVERVYFRDAVGPLQFEQDAWVIRQSISGEDVDAIEVWRTADDLAVFRKRFFSKERSVLEITYDKREIIRGQNIARHVVLTDARGFSLEFTVTDYEPGFPVPDERLRLGD